MNKVVIGGKKYTATSGNEVIAGNTNEELDNHFNGSGIDAQWTRHIANINEQLKHQVYKSGPPKKIKAVPQQIEKTEANVASSYYSKLSHNEYFSKWFEELGYKPSGKRVKDIEPQMEMGV